MVFFLTQFDSFPGSFTHANNFSSSPVLSLLNYIRSSASGLGSDTSDVDLCITRDNFDRSEPYSNLENIIAALRNGGMTKVLPLLHARVPIVTFVDPVFRIECDICCNELIGVYGSKLIGCYVRIDPRIKPLIYNVKALVKAHGINDASQGFYSTFAYMMMIIGFLQAQVNVLILMHGPMARCVCEERNTETVIFSVYYRIRPFYLHFRHNLENE